MRLYISMDRKRYAFIGTVRFEGIVVVDEVPFLTHHPFFDTNASVDMNAEIRSVRHLAGAFLRQMLVVCTQQWQNDRVIELILGQRQQVKF